MYVSFIFHTENSSHAQCFLAGAGNRYKKNKKRKSTNCTPKFRGALTSGVEKTVIIRIFKPNSDQRIAINEYY